MSKPKFKVNQCFTHKEQPCMMLVDGVEKQSGGYLYTLKVMDTASREVKWKRYYEEKLAEVAVKVGDLNATSVLFGKRGK